MTMIMRTTCVCRLMRHRPKRLTCPYDQIEQGERCVLTGSTYEADVTESFECDDDLMMEVMENCTVHHECLHHDVVIPTLYDEGD